MTETKRLPAVVVPANALDNFVRFADENGVTVSQAIRDALTEYAVLHWGVEIDFSVAQWGGKREVVSE